MTESQVKTVLLVRALEETCSSEFTPGTIQRAFVEAGSPDDRLDWIHRRALSLLARLPNTYRSIRLASLPPQVVCVGLTLSAFVTGLLSAPLSREGQIHLFVNPIMGLVVWNLAFLIGSIVFFTRRKAVPNAVTSGGFQPAQDAIWAIWSSVGRLGRIIYKSIRIVSYPFRARTSQEETAATESQRRTQVRWQFQQHYARTCHEAIVHRLKATLSIAAIAFAIGALASMYFWGIGFDYVVTWDSALVREEPARSRLVKIIFAPALLVLGQSFPAGVEIQGLSEPSGTPAATWISVYALMVVSCILVPRFLLVALEIWLARRSGRSIVLDLSDDYWTTVLEAPGNREILLLHSGIIQSFTLDSNALGVLNSLKLQVIDSDLRDSKVRKLGGLDPLARKKDWLLQWRSSLEEEFQQFPAEDRPKLTDTSTGEFGEAVQAVRKSSNRYTAATLLMQLADFDPYSREVLRNKSWRESIKLPLSSSRKTHLRALTEASSMLGKPDTFAGDLRKDLAAARGAMSQKRLKVGVWATGGMVLAAVSFGIAAPAIGGLIGSTMGLSGAAAVNAGLAAIGFGALSAGGLGMAGGTAVIVGGGALIGVAIGGSGAVVASGMTREGALRDLAQIEVFLRRIVVGEQSDWKQYELVTSELKALTNKLAAEIPDAAADPKVSARRVRELDAIVKLFRRAVSRAESWEKEIRETRVEGSGEEGE